MGSENPWHQISDGVEDVREEPFLLRVGAESDDGWADQHEAENIGERRRTGQRHLFGEDDLLHERGAAAAEFLGPIDAGPAGRENLFLPLAQEFKTREHLVFGAMFFPIGGDVGMQPGAQLIAESKLRWGEVEIHVWIAYQWRAFRWAAALFYGPRMNANERELVVEKLIGAVYEVSNVLGAGFLEKVYERALVRELASVGLQAEAQLRFPVLYKGQCVGEYLGDIIVEHEIVVELKCVESFTKEHIAQCINYLKATNLQLALLINFQKPKVEWKRVVYHL